MQRVAKSKSKIQAQELNQIKLSLNNYTTERQLVLTFLGTVCKNVRKTLSNLQIDLVIVAMTDEKINLDNEIGPDRVKKG